MKGALLGLAVVIVAAGAGAIYLKTAARGFSAREEPTALESWIARAARGIAVPDSVKSLRNPTADTADVLSQARAHWADHCATCHANNGNGDTEMGRNLYPRVPDMRQPGTQNLTDGELFSIIENGVRLSGMPAWGGSDHSSEDSWKLVRFIRHLPQVSPEEEREMQKLNPRTPADLQEEKEEQEFLKGLIHMHTTIRITKGGAAFAVALVLLLTHAPVISAHGGFEHVLGTVTKISAESVTVETTAKKSVEVAVNSKTTYARGGRTLAASDLKVGDRVVIDAKPESSKLVAASVKIGVAGKISTVDHAAHPTQ